MSVKCEIRCCGMCMRFQELDLDINPKPLVFILHSFLAAKLSRLGLA